MENVVEQFLDMCREPLPPRGGHRPRYTRILITPVTGGSSCYLLREGLIAHALRLRGCEVSLLICDATIPICNDKSIDTDSPTVCARCTAIGRDWYGRLNIPTYTWRDIIGNEDLTTIRRRVEAMDTNAILSYREKGIDFGKLVWSAFLRYHLSGEVDPYMGPEHLRTVRAFLTTALIASCAIRKLHARQQFDKIFTSHGYYAVWGGILETALSLGVDADSYNSGELRNTIRCKHNAPSSPINFDEEWPKWSDVALRQAERDQLRSYFGMKDVNAGEFIRYHAVEENDAIVRSVGQFLHNGGGGRLVCIYTNVMWDAITSGMNSCFNGMLQWLRQTVRILIDMQNVRVLIRVHPGEVRKPEKARQTVELVLRKEFGDLPANFLIVHANDAFHSSRLYNLEALHIVYYSTVGLEIALRGRCPLVAGNTSYSKKGFTADPDSSRAYTQAIIEYLRTGRWSCQPDIEAAERFAYFWFFRKCIPFSPLELDVWTPVALNISCLDELRPGRARYLDLICDGIAMGTEFVS